MAAPVSDYTTGVDVAGNPITFHHMPDYGSGSCIYWHTSQWRTVEYQNGVYDVHRYNLLASTWRGDCTEGIYYGVYEPSSLMGNHSSITSDPAGGGYLGDITTRRLPVTLDALPAYSEARSSAVGAYHEELKDLARMVARAAFPEYADHEPIMF